MVPFRQTVMASSTSTSPGNDASIPTIDDLRIPIIAPEIKKSLPASTTSAGLDDLTFPAESADGGPAEGA